MNSDTKKPQAPGRPDTPARREPAVTTNNSGRVTHDERGNAVWQWAVTTGALAIESATHKLKKLDNPTLSLVDDAPPSPVAETVKKNPLGTVKGYSPYDSGLLEKKETPRKKDLRRLSEWLKLKKQAENRRDDE